MGNDLQEGRRIAVSRGDEDLVKAFTAAWTSRFGHGSERETRNGRPPLRNKLTVQESVGRRMIMHPWKHAVVASISPYAPWKVVWELWSWLQFGSFKMV